MTWLGIAFVALVVSVPPAVAAPDLSLPPARAAALFRWLRAGAYRRGWVGEPAVHVSETGAHGLHVRTWYSPALAQDLARGTLPYRRGAAMVKELYGGTDDVVGWSVMRKVRRRSGGGRGLSAVVVPALTAVVEDARWLPRRWTVQ